jgi:hypothetical protein
MFFWAREPGYAGPGDGAGLCRSGFGCSPTSVLAGRLTSQGEGWLGFVGGWGLAPSPSLGLPEVITYAQGPLALVGGLFRFLRPLAACDQALPRPTEGEDTQS